MTKVLALRHSFRATKNKVYIGKEMDSGNIVLIDNQVYLLNDAGAAFFGRLKFTLVRYAAKTLRKHRLNEKVPAHVFIDEAGGTIGTGEQAVSVMARLRSQGVGLLVAHRWGAALHLIVGLCGTQRSGAVVPLRVLCGAAVFRLIYDASVAVTRATGHFYAEIRRQVLHAALGALASVLGACHGITGVVLGIAGAILYYMYLAMAQLVIRVTEARWRDFFRVQLPRLLLAALAAAAAILARATLERQGVGSLHVLAGIISVCAAVLPLGIYLLWEQIRPTELFRKVDPAVARPPGVVRLPIRRVLRMPATEMGAV